MTELKDRTQVSADELEARMQAQEECHDKPLRNVTEFISGAIIRVLHELGVDVSLSDEMIKLQQEALDIKIAEAPPEQMGELSGFYVSAGDTPIAIIGDPFLARDGKAYLKIYWIQTDIEETYGGVRIIQ